MDDGHACPLSFPPASRGRGRGRGKRPLAGSPGPSAPPKKKKKKEKKAGGASPVVVDPAVSRAAADAERHARRESRASRSELSAQSQVFDPGV